MPFRLKNEEATYQRLMNKVFSEHIGYLLEIHIEDILVKIKEDDNLLFDLGAVFSCLQQHNMMLNLQKCAFTIEVGKFLGFMLIHRGTEKNPDKCRSILKMKSSTPIMKVQRLTSRIASFSRFMATSAQEALPFFSLLKKESTLNGC